MILGLDISTSITGATIIDEKGNVVLNEAWELKKFNNHYEKAQFVRSQIARLLALHLIDKVYIEESLQAFRPGYSSAKTLLTLAKFNGTVSWLIYDILGIEPEYISAASARKACGIKIPRGLKAKQVVMEHMLDKEPWFVVEYTHHGNPKPKCFDKADSFVIAKAGFLRCRETKKQ
jgi:hypothetical protein